MENKDGQVELRKVPIAILIDALNDIYESGFDFVDIIGMNGVEQDTIGLRFKSDYVLPKDEEEMDAEDIEERTKNIKLSDDDLNQLT